MASDRRLQPHCSQRHSRFMTAQTSLFDAGSGASFSDCRRYRYRLWRRWDTEIRPLLFVMLNPSTADEDQLDATVTRCLNRAKTMGAGGLEVVNLFAWVSTDRTVLPSVSDPAGPLNDKAIKEAAATALAVICAWGTDGALNGRDKQVSALLRDAGIQPLALAINRDGSPKHPLYISGSAEPFPWSLP